MSGICYCSTCISLTGLIIKSYYYYYYYYFYSARLVLQSEQVGHAYSCSGTNATQ